MIKIEYHGELVLTTKQLAEAYGCSTDHIRHNFADFKAEFTEGVHYFKLEGAELKAFKMYVGEILARVEDVTDSPVQNLPKPDVRLATRALYLWTHRGAVRHCKLVNTRAAWDMFTQLENIYFAVVENPPQIQPSDDDIPNGKLELLIKLVESYGGVVTLERILDKLIKLTR